MTGLLPAAAFAACAGWRLFAKGVAGRQSVIVADPLKKY
jgi:hypothetical protein